MGVDGVSLVGLDRPGGFCLRFDDWKESFGQTFGARSCVLVRAPLFKWLYFTACVSHVLLEAGWGSGRESSGRRRDDEVDAGLTREGRLN